MSLQRLLFVPDTHRPYHDKRAWNVMLKAADRFRPSRIITLGDFVDCAAVSSHSKDPARLARFKHEIADANRGLDDLETFKPDHMHFIEGNHEDRLPRYLMDKAPELTDVLEISIPALLRLDSRGWQFTPYKQSLRLGHLNITHDTGTAGPQAHRQAREAFEGNAVIGHTHRMASYYSGNARGKPRVGMSFGWLGDVEKVDYMHRIQAMRAWQLGFGIGWMDRRGYVHLQPVPVVEYSVVLNGEVVK